MAPSTRSHAVPQKQRAPTLVIPWAHTGSSSKEWKVLAFCRCKSQLRAALDCQTHVFPQGITPPFCEAATALICVLQLEEFLFAPELVWSRRRRREQLSQAATPRSTEHEQLDCGRRTSLVLLKKHHFCSSCFNERMPRRFFHFCDEIFWSLPGCDCYSSVFRLVS